MLSFEWLAEYALTERLEEIKEKHYMNIFQGEWQGILTKSSRLYAGERLFLMHSGGETAGMCIAEFSRLEMKIRDFSILPEYRGNKMGEKILGEIEREAKELGAKEISTIIYPVPEKPEHFTDMERFGMALFFLKQGFVPNEPANLSSVERSAMQIYTSSMPEYAGLLKQFRKAVK